MSAEPNRKLSTIVFTDIAGFSELMRENEQLTLKMLELHDRMAEEIFSGYRGRIVKKLGDGLLAVFESVNEAFLANRMFQEEIKSFNNENPDGKKLLVRVGIHAGDIIEKGGDIFGNGVNVASRLQQICIPGGICLSQAAHAALDKSNAEKLRLVPDVILKNISERYNVFMLPSIYPEEFRLENVAEMNADKENFVIKNIHRIPPEKFSLIDSLLITVGILVLVDFAIAGFITYLTGITLNEAILNLSGDIWFLIYNVVFIFAFTLIFLRDSIKVDFEDVRGVDNMLSHIIQRFGFRPPERKNGILIFKPSVYNLLIWWSQKMRVSVNGNHVIISGSYIFLRKVKKMLKSFRK